MIDIPLIFKRGFPGKREAESLEGIKITVLDIIFINNLCVQETQILNSNI